MRRPAIIFMLLATGGLAGCGGGAHHRPATATFPHKVRHAPAGATSTSTLTRAQALAFAQAVNLTAADVPGFKSSTEHHEHETAAEKRLEHGLFRCVGGALGNAGRGGGDSGGGANNSGSGSSGGGSSSSSEELASMSSQDFALEHGVLDFDVRSEVSFARTPALAARELEAIRNSRVRECVSRYLRALLNDQRYGSGASVGKVSILDGTPPAPGTTGGFGWRITATIEAHKLALPFYLDILGFVYGSAKVSLFSSGALRPFPAAVQQHLFSLLLARAKAHHV